LVELARRGEDPGRPDESKFVLRAALLRAGKNPATIPTALVEKPKDKADPGAAAMEPQGGEAVPLADAAPPAQAAHRQGQADEASKSLNAVSNWALHAHRALMAQPLGIPPEEGVVGFVPAPARGEGLTDWLAAYVLWREAAGAVPQWRTKELP